MKEADILKILIEKMPEWNDKFDWIEFEYELIGIICELKKLGILKVSPP